MNLGKNEKHLFIGVGSAIALLALSLGVPSWKNAGPIVSYCHFIPGTGTYKLEQKREKTADKHLEKHANDVLAGNAYADVDDDGFGDPLSGSVLSCPAEAYVDNDLDCDDLDPLIHPDAEELCDDLVDNNCNGVVDEECGVSLVIDGETVSVSGGPEHLPADLFPAGDPVLIEFMDSETTTINGNYFFQDDTHAYTKRYFSDSGGVLSQEFKSSRTGAQGEASFQTLGLTLNTWDADSYRNSRYENIGRILLSGEPVTLSFFKHVTTTGEYSRRVVQFDTIGRCSPLRFDMRDPAYCDLRSNDDSIRLVIEYKLEHRLNDRSNPRVAVLGIGLSENLGAYRDTLSYFDSGRTDLQTSVNPSGQDHAPDFFVSMNALDPQRPHELEVGIDILFDSGIMLSGALVSPLAAFGDETFPVETHSQCLDPTGSPFWTEHQLRNAWFVSTEIQKGCYEHSGDRKGFYKTQMDLQNPGNLITITPPGPLLSPPAVMEDRPRPAF